MPSGDMRSGGQSRADVRWVCRYLVVGGSEGWVESRCRCVRIVTVLSGLFFVCLSSGCGSALLVSNQVVGRLGERKKWDEGRRLEGSVDGAAALVRAVCGKGPISRSSVAVAAVASEGGA